MMIKLICFNFPSIDFISCYCNGRKTNDLLKKFSSTHRFIDTKDIFDDDMYLFNLDGWNK